MPSHTPQEAQLYDLLIIGAGPAGSATALAAAQAGLRVALLERAHFPRHRPGETLPPGIEPLLAHLGLDNMLHVAGALRHPGTWVSWNAPAAFEPFGGDARGPWRGFQICRADFDHRLLDCARTMGVEVREGSAVHSLLLERGRVAGVMTKNGFVRARCTIDATGERHWLARQLPIAVVRCSPPLFARYGYMQGICPGRDEAPYLQATRAGWTWTARVAPSLYQWTRLALQSARFPPTWRPTEFSGLTDTGPVRGADVTWRMGQQLAGAGFFLVGDAACVLDPASSHGVLKAMMSGMMAAHLIAAVSKGDSDEAAAVVYYHRWCSAWFRHDVQKLGEAYERVGLFIAKEFSMLGCMMLIALLALFNA